VQHRGGGGGSIVASHRGGGESSMVVTTLIVAENWQLVTSVFISCRPQHTLLKIHHHLELVYCFSLLSYLLQCDVFACIASILTRGIQKVHKLI